jgi:anthranilate/para-aminobenzoate synthase component II
MSEQQIPRVVLINNYSEGKGSERLRRLEESIASFSATVQTFPYNDIPIDKVRGREFDCLVLSGSNLNVSNFTDRKKMVAEINLLKEIEIPVLAICFGLHLAVCAYGGKIERNESSGEFCLPHGKEIAIEIQNDPGRLICCPKVQVNVNHKDYVSPGDPQLLRSFEVSSLSTDKDKRYLQYAKHKEKAIFCVQFHPESFDSATPIVKDTGLRIIHNFLNIVLKVVGKKAVS